MFRCGFVRSNFALAMDVTAPFVLCCGSGRGYSPRTRAVISWAIDSGTCWYESNCIV